MAPDPAAQPLAKRPVQIAAGAQVQALIPRDLDQVYRLASWIATAGWAPKSYLVDPKEASKGFSVTKIALGIIQGLEVGLSPVAALQSIAVINGMPSIYGDGGIALVQASGLLEDWREVEIKDASGKVLGWKVSVKRRNQPTWREAQFTMEDAVKAKLATKPGPWQEYPTRQCLWRARAWAFRAGFADVLRGLHFAEEAIDITAETTVVGATAAPAASATAKGALDAFSGAGEPPKEGVVHHQHEDPNGGNQPAATAAAAPAAAGEARPDPNFVEGMERGDRDRVDHPLMDGAALASFNADGKWMQAWKWLSMTIPEQNPVVAQKIVTRYAHILRAVMKHSDRYAEQVNELLTKAQATLPDGK
ncbi:MAG TPA: hypothetical protein VI229_07860 [Burkholderiales bacterium]